MIKGRLKEVWTVICAIEVLRREEAQTLNELRANAPAFATNRQKYIELLERHPDIFEIWNRGRFKIVILNKDVNQDWIRDARVILFNMVRFAQAVGIKPSEILAGRLAEELYGSD